MNRKVKGVYHQQELKNVRVSKEKIEEIGERMYKHAMKHMNRFNEYDKDRKKKKQQPEPVPSQCTFKPQIFTQKYKNRCVNVNTHKKGEIAHNRLVQWGKKRDKKIIEKRVNRSVQDKEKSIRLNLNRSTEDISLVPSKGVLKNLSYGSMGGRNKTNYSSKYSYMKSQASLLLKTENSFQN